MNRPENNANNPQQQPRHLLRLVAGIILVVLALPVLAGLILAARFNPNKYAPALITAVEQATGRQLTLGGPITMQLSLTPSLEASNISLSNPPGFADANLITLSHVEAQIALLPLLSHHIDILKLVLVEPDIVLERQANGTADWDFSTPHAVTPASPAAPLQKTAHPHQAYTFALEAVEIQNGKLTVKAADNTPPCVIQLSSLTGKADALDAPLHISAQAALGNAPFILSGVLGPAARFSGIGNGPWPVDLTLNLAGATATVLGAIDHPRTAQGYDLSVNLAIPALETLAQSLPGNMLKGTALPALHNLTATAQVTDQGSPFPAVTNLSLKAGASDLSALRPGLSLAGLNLEMAGLDQPLTLNATGKLGNDTLSLQGKLGPLQALLPAAWLPAAPASDSFPISIQAQIGAAQASLTGAIATPATLSGAALALSASIPNLSALSPEAGAALPGWKNIMLQTTLIDPGGQGLRNAIGIDSLTATMDNAAFGGAGSLYFGPQPRLQLALKISQMNLDALQAAMPSPAPETPPKASGSAAPSAPPTAPRSIPSTPLPLGLLKAASADIQASAYTLTWQHATYTALQGHAQLANGLLTLSPVTGQLPGGSINASASIDASKEPAAETLQLSAPALALAPFLNAFGLPDTGEGTVQAQLNATSQGDNPHAMAASLNGQLGLASVGDVVDGAVLNRLFGTALSAAGLPSNLAGAQGPATIRCAALRIDATNGIGTIRALTVDSSRLFIQGGGSVDFGQETLGITLRPQIQAGGTNLTVPVTVGGSFTQPHYGIAPAGAIKAAGLGGNNSVLAKAANLLGLADNSAHGDACPAALSLARMGQSGPAAPAASALPSGAITAPSSALPKNLLNTLLGQ